MEWVDLVCVNLYPFERTAGRRDATDAEVIEDIDVGGPTMVRAAAKNHAFTAPVVRPEAYDAILAELEGSDGLLSMTTRQNLAGEAFALTARYDTAIARWFADRDDDFPALQLRAYTKLTDLRYGENPHQRAAFYQEVGARTHLLSRVRQLHGKELSFNNLLDLDGARGLAREFDVPACVIVKHNNPCGAALAGTVGEAYAKAFACDPLSAYGGVIVLNRQVDVELAQRLHAQFVEVVLAPGYDDEALALLTAKENIRVLFDEERRVPRLREPEVRQVQGGLLIQDRDADRDEREAMQVVTRRVPDDAQFNDLLFAWQVAKHVRSNAIVLARDLATVGIGAGQMSRVDSVRLAVEKAQTPVAGSALASDAFFPFADGPQLAVAAGVTTIVQPGGSVRDAEVVAAADAADVAMVFTGRRHFRH